MYYCEKCGYLGKEGPIHQTSKIDNVGTCGFAATPLPAHVGWALDEAWRPLRALVPDHATLTISIESGGGIWVKHVGPIFSSVEQKDPTGAPLISRMAEVMKDARRKGA